MLNCRDGQDYATAAWRRMPLDKIDPAYPVVCKNYPIEKEVPAEKSTRFTINKLNLVIVF